MPKEISKEIPKDISKKTVAILVIVAIIISVTSTLLAVSGANKAQSVVVNEDTDSAQVSLIVLPPPADEEGAQVSLNVVEGGAK